jgi:5-methylcytosine-specific restriction protein A
MPTRPPRFEPLGRKKAPEEKQRKKLLDDRRGSSAARGYDSAWQRLRKRFLRKNPLCVFCMEQGLLTEAAVVDHIITISERPDLRLVWGNLRSLCKRCHDRRTAKEQGFAKPKTK